MDIGDLTEDASKELAANNNECEIAKLMNGDAETVNL